MARDSTVLISALAIALCLSGLVWAVWMLVIATDPGAAGEMADGAAFFVSFGPGAAILVLVVALVFNLRTSKR